MKHLARITIFIGLILAFAFAAGVQAAESGSTDPSADSSIASTKEASSNAEGTKSSGKLITKDANKKADRSLAATRSHLDPVWIHNTWVDYVTDIDGDGFYHHFRFSFDADTHYVSQALYAEVYLSDGQDQWRIFTSNTFWINGSSGGDVYEISTSLNEGYPTQTYDLTLRLYDAVTHELLTEWDYLDDSELDSLFLEDADRDTLFSSSPYIHHFELNLRDDFDADGYYSQVNMEVDVDAPNTRSDIRIGVELYDPYDGWESLYLSNEISISGSTTHDNQSITINLDQGYPEDLYQLRITVYEAVSRAVITTETISQTVALESLEHEGDTHEHRSSSSHGHGGAMGLLALPLIALGIIRKQRSRKSHY
ncbi:MAG: choice-of-anchor H family protein [Pseudomonadales bacterium]|nr:choice-of-anchor H family protein [Pseudomonadales bacterium]